jgi:uncharacterized protein YutE (UPF0331/DUF86 family)
VTPGRPDREVVRRHLAALDDAVRHLRRHAGKSLADLATDRDASWAVERGLQLCAQNVLDAATHIAVSSGRDVPDYASAIDALADLGVLPAAFAATLRDVAGFRNVLVHGYLDVDPKRVHAALNERLDDFVEFARFVDRHVG